MAEKEKSERPRFDVAIVGAGPVGLTLANYLGLYGVETLLIERHASTVQEPRAVSIDDESLRAMQGIGLAEQVCAHIMPGYGSLYHSASGTPFAFVQPKTKEYGYDRRNGFHQWDLERILCDGLERFENVTVWFENELVDLSYDSDGVSLKLRATDEREIQVECRYLAACDGGGSTVRELLGVAMEGSTYNEKWLIIDLDGTKDPYRHTRVYCDPRRPGINLPGPRRARRFEFMLLDGEDPDTVAAESNVRRLLREHGPDEQTRIRRRTVYTFHARMATRWKIGRVSLHGDAAHLTPPFAGQGMNSGIRDATNYAWKLASVITGKLGPAVLETYELERRKHAWALIEMAIRMGRVMMPRGRIAAFVVQATFRLLKLCPPLNDYIVHMRFKPKPRFEQGFFLADGHDPKTSIAGRLFSQPNVAFADDRLAKLDEALGEGFALLALTDRPTEMFGQIDEDSLAPLEVKRVCVTPDDVNFPADCGADVLFVRDVDGDVARALAGYRDCAILLRPDRYVAAVFRPAEVNAVLQNLRKMIDSTWTA
jgi:3-(3-hydroxy-phenyl)propionate hydroxylase